MLVETNIRRCYERYFRYGVYCMNAYFKLMVILIINVMVGVILYALCHFLTYVIPLVFTAGTCIIAICAFATREKKSEEIL